MDLFRKIVWRLNGSARVIARLGSQLEEIRGRLEAVIQRPALEELVMGVCELRDRVTDLELLLLRDIHCPLRLITAHPVAASSDDYKYPRGAKNDNTRHPRFVRRVEELFTGKAITHLDVGCAGGGLVLDFLLRGHTSVGVDGSDFSFKERRAEWRVIPDHLFTCDVTEEFHFEQGDGTPSRFDLITAWEVLEHLPEDRLAPFFGNVRRNLTENGLFAASVATFEDTDPVSGAVYHVTVKDRTWWERKFLAEGLALVDGLFEGKDYPRGSGNPRVGPFGTWDWDASSAPQLGFHITAKVAK